MIEIERFECIGCEGRGEVYAGYRDPETNALIGVTCVHCGGLGAVADEQVICDICEQPCPVDDVCPHRSAVLCGACSVDECLDCCMAVQAANADDRSGLDLDRFWLDAS